MLAAAQAPYRLKATEDPYLALIYARCPVDKWVGVNTHCLNELWTVEGARGTFAWWFLRYSGAAMVLEDSETNGYGVFKQRTSKAVTTQHGTRFEIFFGGYGHVTTQDGTSRSESLAASVGD